MIPLSLKAVLGLGSFLAASGAKAADAGTPDPVCSCLEPPDCKAICSYGGVPKGNGSQACVCFAPPDQALKEVCYTGKYPSLLNRPNRALAETDGGPASDSLALNGYSFTSSAVSAPSYVVALNGTYFDIIPTVELNDQHMACTATTYTALMNGKTLRVTRDNHGRLTNVTFA